MGETWSGRRRGTAPDAIGDAGSGQVAPSRASRSADDGASLAEFALVFPLLILLLMGVIEFGWLVAQHLDVRHGAREGARMAVVNYPEGSDPPVMTRTQANTDGLLAETCDRMNIASQPAVTFASAGAPGDPVTVTAVAPADTLSGLLDWAIPSTFELSSTVILHSEQDATWADTDPVTYPNGQPCP